MRGRRSAPPTTPTAARRTAASAGACRVDCCQAGRARVTVVALPRIWIDDSADACAPRDPRRCIRDACDRFAAERVRRTRIGRRNHQIAVKPSRLGDPRARAVRAYLPRPAHRPDVRAALPGDNHDPQRGDREGCRPRALFGQRAIPNSAGARELPARAAGRSPISQKLTPNNHRAQAPLHERRHRLRQRDPLRADDHLLRQPPTTQAPTAPTCLTWLGRSNALIIPRPRPQRRRTGSTTTAIEPVGQLIT